MAIDAKKYFEDVLKEAGVAEDKRQAALDAFADEKVTKKFQSDFVPRSEYSRSMDELTAKEKKYTEWYDGVLATTAKNEEAVKQANDTVTRYQAVYGDLPADGSHPMPVVKGMTKEEFDKEMARREGQTIFLLKKVPALTMDYYQRFGKQLDLDALEKIAVEKQLPLDAAYRELISPEVQAKQATDLEATKKAEYERGLTEGRSRTNVPVDAKPRDSYHTIFDATKEAREKAPTDERGRLSGFVEAWNSATSAP